MDHHEITEIKSNIGSKMIKISEAIEVKKVTEVTEITREAAGIEAELELVGEEDVDVVIEMKIGRIVI